ncbi:MAG: ATP phosphoribosyltransferase regulatory subunit [Alphaproteobacteria bacterium GM7ARS4]|nr:ATP phosphoribosyltransferase regulatory subunit [Alphaproteobacteria bacterium GM7ARS4]
MNRRHQEPLPVGFEDVVPPHADRHEDVLYQIMRDFRMAGYQCVTPSLFEFETHDYITTLHSVDNRIKVIDPISNHTMCLRNDFTTQVARIACTRLGSMPRPLRLCYQGDITNAQSDALIPARQFKHVGIEFFGAESERADSEVILMGVDALRHTLMSHITVDLNMPPLTQALFTHYAIQGDDADDMRKALNNKDETFIKTSLHDDAAHIFIALIRCAGKSKDAIEQIRHMTLPPSCQPPCHAFLATAQRIDDDIHIRDDVTLILDPLENRGFAYHSGITFSYFARDARYELGRGGRYIVDDDDMTLQRHPHHKNAVPRQKTPLIARHKNREQAVGLTLFLDSIMRVVPSATTAKKVYALENNSRDTIARWRQQGVIVIHAMCKGDKAFHQRQARLFQCSAILDNETLEELL